MENKNINNLISEVNNKLQKGESITDTEIKLLEFYQKRRDNLTSIVVAGLLIPVILASVTFAFNQKSQTDLEKTKFKSLLILKAIEPPSDSVRINNLKFLQKMGLIEINRDSLTSLQKEFESIKKSGNKKIDFSPTSGANSSLNMAKHWEEIGFKALKERNINGAITSFEKAEANLPTYHSVYEILRFLQKEQKNLSEASNAIGTGNEKVVWDRIDKTIREKYSWGMPDWY